MTEVQAKLKTLTDTDISNKAREIFAQEQKIEKINTELNESKKLIAPHKELDTLEFENNNSELLQVEYANLGRKTKRFSGEKCKGSRATTFTKAAK